MGRGTSSLDTSKWLIDGAVAKDALSGMITIPHTNCGKELWIVTQESANIAPVLGSLSFDGTKVSAWTPLDPVDLNRPRPSVTDTPMGLAWDPQTGLLIAQSKMTSQQTLYGSKDVSKKGTLQGIPGVNDPQTDRIIPIGGDVKWDGKIATYYTLFGNSTDEKPVNKMYSMVIDWEAVYKTTTTTTTVAPTTTSKAPTTKKAVNEAVNEAMASNLRSLTSTAAFPWNWSSPETWTTLITPSTVKATVRDIAFSNDGSKLYGVGSAAAATKAESMFEEAAYEGSSRDASYGGKRYVYTMTAADGKTVSKAVEVDISPSTVTSCVSGSPWRIESVAYLDGTAFKAAPNNVPILVMLVKDLPPTTTTSTKAPTTSTTKASTAKAVTEPPPYKCGGIYTITVASVEEGTGQPLALTQVLKGAADTKNPYVNSNNYLGIATCRQQLTPTITFETTTTTTTTTTTPTTTTPPPTTTAGAVVTTTVPITKPSSASAMIGGIGCVVMMVASIM